MSTERYAGKTAALGQPADVSCEGKVAFDTLKLAAGVVKRNSRTNKPRRTAYRCLHCRKWHLGTDVGRVRKRRAADLRRLKSDERDD